MLALQRRVLSRCRSSIISMSCGLVRLKCHWLLQFCRYINSLLSSYRLFEYTQGANLNCSRLAMTLPVLTSIVPGAGPLHSSAYVVRFYLPTKFQLTPPTPLPELKLEPYDWSSHYVAVRKFPGFALDDIVVKEAEKLALGVSRSTWANITSKSDYAYSIAQYSTPFKIIGRVNEVWVDVEVAGVNGHKLGGVASS